MLASNDEVAVSAGRQVQYPLLAVVFGDDVAVVDIPDSSYVLRSDDVAGSVSLHEPSFDVDGPSKDDVPS